MAAATAALVVWSMALCAMSDWDSVSSIFEPAAVLPLAFLVSCSRGSSWQRWPMLRLIHLVQGLSYSKQRATQRSVSVFALVDTYSGAPAPRGARAVPYRAVQPQHGITALDGLGKGGEGEHKGKGLTYEVACHMLWQYRRTVLAMRLFYPPTPKRACRMRATGHVAAVALDHGNSLRRRQPIARPHRGVSLTYRSTAIYASCRNAETQG